MSTHEPDQLREEVCYVNKMLPAAGLVTMHSGNASGLDRASGRLVIKPSGMDYDKPHGPRTWSRSTWRPAR